MAFFDKTKFKVHGNGFLDIPLEWKEIVAVHESGEITYLTGKRFDSHVKMAEKYVKTVLRKNPVFTEKSLEDIADLHTESEEIFNKASSEEHAMLMAKILEDAAKSKAADIKIMRHPDITNIRFIIAGQEIDYDEEISSDLGKQLIAYLFVSRDDGAGHPTKMDGLFQGFSISANSKIKTPTNLLKMRCQKGFHETDFGIMDHVAIRVFYRESEEMASLEDLGLDPLALAALKRSRDGMKGATIIGGETGDGKSTTLISTIKRQYDENNGKVSIVTIEDPVEYKLDHRRYRGVSQIPIQSAGTAEERHYNYQETLRHFVRINPHIGMIGEMRDAEGARQVLQFIETGHQIWTTIHINSVSSIPFRIIDMGIEPTELSKPDSIQLMMKQTLVPMLCRCARRGDDGYLHRNENGCRTCKSKANGKEAVKAWVGFQRLIAVAEFIEPDDEYLECIRANNAIKARNHWLKSKEEGGLGGVTLKKKLCYLASMGAIDPINAIRKGAKEGVDIPEKNDDMNGIEMDNVYREWISSLLFFNRKS